MSTSSNYLQHLTQLAQEEKSRLFNVPPFHVLLGLAAFTHIALLAPVLFVQVADAIPKTKQVRLAFGIDGAAEKQPIITKDAATEKKVAPPAPKQKTTPIIKQQLIRQQAAKTPEPQRISNDSVESVNRSAPSSVMVRPDRAKVANLRSGGGGYKSDIATRGEVVGKYEQLLSGWINSHRLNKMLTLPAGASGRVVVRLRINRRGYVIFKAIEQSSNDAALDAAAIESVTRASPVPAVPSEYPGGAQLEFLIPISFVVN